MATSAQNAFNKRQAQLKKAGGVRLANQKKAARVMKARPDDVQARNAAAGRPKAKPVVKKAAAKKAITGKTDAQNAVLGIPRTRKRTKTINDLTRSIR